MLQKCCGFGRAMHGLKASFPIQASTELASLEIRFIRSVRITVSATYTNEVELERELEEQ